MDLMDRLVRKSRSYGGYDDYRPCQRPHIDQASPDDVRKRAAQEIDSLKRRIASAKETIAACEEELKFWQQIK